MKRFGIGILGVLIVIGVVLFFCLKRKIAAGCSINVMLGRSAQVWKCGIRSVPEEKNVRYSVGKLTGVSAKNGMVWANIDFGGITREMRIGIVNKHSLMVFERDPSNLDEVERNKNTVEKIYKLDETGIRGLNSYNNRYVYLVTMNPLGAGERLVSYQKLLGEVTGESAEKLKFGIDYLSNCQNQVKDYYSYLETREGTYEVVDKFRNMVDSNYKNCSPIIETLWVFNK